MWTLRIWQAIRTIHEGRAYLRSPLLEKVLMSLTGFLQPLRVTATAEWNGSTLSIADAPAALWLVKEKPGFRASFRLTSRGGRFGMYCRWPKQQKEVDTLHQ